MKTLLLTFAIFVACCAHADVGLLSPNLPVGGRTQLEWSQRWWMWAASFGDEGGPVADRSGRLCHLKQEGPVWFLAGTYGTQRTVRTCVVPRDKFIFFPLINYVMFPPPDGVSTCADLIASAAEITDDVTSLVLEVDGRRYENLERHRLASRSCFDLNELANDGARIDAAANGYYAMLPPLSAGTHTINFGGRAPGMSQAVTYTLIVK